MLARHFHLALVALVAVAAGGVIAADWLPDGQSPGSYDPPATQGVGNTNQKPKIVNFKVTTQPGGTAIFSGSVQDENPAGLTVTLSGPQGCLQPGGIAVVTDANGNFTYSGSINRTTDNGIVSANTADAEGQAADTATYRLIF